jgi:hypothetical protein
MQVDFSAKGGAVPAPVINPEPQPAGPVGVTGTPGPVGDPGTSTTTAVTTTTAPGGLVLGDKLPTFAEIILPRVNIVQGSGLLKDRFAFGSLVYDAGSGGGTVLFTPPDIDKATGNIKRAGSPPVVITALGFNPTRYVEHVPGGGRGLIVNTEDAVLAAGGTLDYNEWKLKAASGMKRFEYLAEAVVLIERPDAAADDDTVFVYEVEGKKYALGLWGLKGTAYTAAAKRVFFTHRQNGCLRAGYPTYSYNCSTMARTSNNNTYSVPVCVPRAKNTPAFLAFVKSILEAPEHK